MGARWTANLRNYCSPVFLSTMADGRIVEGLGGLSAITSPTPTPTTAAAAFENGVGTAHSAAHSGSQAGRQHPLLFVGNHQLFAQDMNVMVWGGGGRLRREERLYEVPL